MNSRPETLLSTTSRTAAQFSMPADAGPPLSSCSDPDELECPAHEALSKEDIILEILPRLPSLSDLARACLVCRAWRTAATLDLPWRRLYVRQYGEPHDWEACGSYRQQCARRAWLRCPRPAPPLPGAPCPGMPLERYDELYGITTLAVAYDPVTQSLIRAVRCRTLLGDGARVAVEALPLGQSRPVGHQQLREQRRNPEEEEGGSERRGTAGIRTAGSASVEVTSAVTGGVAGEPQWVCMLSPDGQLQPPPPPPLSRQHAVSDPADGRDDDDQEGPSASGNGSLDSLVRDPSSPWSSPPDHRTTPNAMTSVAAATSVAASAEAAAADSDLLAALLPSVMCTAGGLLYLPAGPMGRGVAVWDLTSATRTTELHPPPPLHPQTQSPHTHTQPHPHTQQQPLLPYPRAAVRQPLLPYWLVPEAHPGRLLAAAADGPLAVSGCEGGRLCFWRAVERRQLGWADIRGLTGLPVVPAFPQLGAPSSTLRHRLRLAVCAASGLAAVLLASPLSPEVRVYRAAELLGGTPAAAACGGGGARWEEQAGGGGDRRRPVGQLLHVLALPGGAPGDGLALFRGRLVTMAVLCNDVMGARFGGSGGSSVLITVTAAVWRLPGAVLAG
ncbi:hypothetical protein Agub_g15011, partial [Astrephomene gubernaculifera]